MGELAFASFPFNHADTAILQTLAFYLNRAMNDSVSMLGYYKDLAWTLGDWQGKVIAMEM